MLPRIKAERILARSQNSLAAPSLLQLIAFTFNLFSKRRNEPLQRLIRRRNAVMPLVGIRRRLMQIYPAPLVRDEFRC